MHKKFQTNSWCRSLLLNHLVHDCQFFACMLMTESIQQRYCIKFCQKLGNSQTETIQKIHQAFGDEAFNQTQIKKWFNHFKTGQMSVESEARSGS